jgi:DNA (cytosine-5)-methyltransferase 1
VNYLSLFSGIEAATVAWHPLGWRPVGFSEIDKFPCAVLEHHYPDVRNYGDVTKHKEWAIEKGTVGLIVGGSPCQSFSVAGLRKGLDDPRGNLTLVFLAVVARFTPRWVVWENVPGVLSDKDNAFGQFLSGLSELGYSCAYRILDSEYFGVPQRRRRVFVVGYLGNWRPLVAVLFEPESLQGDITPSREQGQSVAGGFEIGPSGGRRCDVTPTLDARCKDGPIRNQVGTLVMASGQSNAEVCRDGSPSLTCNHEAPIIIRTAPQTSANGCGIADDVSHTLDGTQGQAVAIHPHAIGRKDSAGPEGKPYRTDGQAYTHDSRGTAQAVQYDMIVRRLTPMEGERLFGLPDNYTRIPYRGKPAADCPDGPRYKALGNSMAVPVMRWIGERIQMYEEVTS